MSDEISPHAPFQAPEGFQMQNWNRGFGRAIGPLWQRTDADGTYVRAFYVEESHCNGLGNAHGGMLMTFADMAFGQAVHLAVADQDKWWVTVRLSCDFLSGAKMGEWVEGTGQIISAVDDVYTVRGSIWVGQRQIIVGTGVFKAIERRG